MPILNQGKEYYPLEFGRMVRDGKVYYDRSARQKSYFYLDFRGSGPAPSFDRFIPSGASGLLTADGKVFRVKTA